MSICRCPRHAAIMDGNRQALSRAMIGGRKLEPLEQIAAWRLADHLAEHGHETRGAFIAEIHRDGLNRMTCAQLTQGQHDMQLPAPAPETHAHLFGQQTAQAALAERDAGGPLRNGRMIRGCRDQQVGELLQARIAGDRQAQVFDRCHRQLIEDNRHNPAVRAVDVIELRKRVGPHQQMPEESRHRDRAAFARQMRRRWRFDEEGNALHFARAEHGMGQPAGNPHGALRRHDPDCVVNFTVDDAANREKQLRFLMLVPRRLLEGLEAGDGIGRDERARNLINIGKPIAAGVEIHEGPRCFPSKAGLKHIMAGLRNDAIRRQTYYFQAQETWPYRANSNRSGDVIDNNPVKLAVAWLVPAVGGVLFVTIQCFSYLNAYVGSGGTMEAMTFDPAMLWAVSISYGAWVCPALLALAARRATDWAMLVLGGLLCTMSTLGGVFDGLRDGGHLVALELLAVTLPGVVAVILSWRHIRAH